MYKGVEVGVIKDEIHIEQMNQIKSIIFQKAKKGPIKFRIHKLGWIRKPKKEIFLLELLFKKRIRLCKMKVINKKLIL